MPEYTYTAIGDTGKVFRGTLVAVSEGEVEERLLQQGLTLIKSRRLKEGFFARFLTGSKVKARILIEFYFRFSQTMELGLPILSALDENAKMLPSKLMKRVIGETRASLENGNSLYEAMSRFPKVFKKLDLSIIMMGEQSGTLPKCLKELAAFFEWKEGIRSTIKRATLYPSFILVAILAVIGVWIGYVLPQMAVLLESMDVALPGVTRAVLGTSLFVQKNWYLLIGVVLLFIILFFIFKKSEKGALLIDKYLLKLPVVGKVATNIAFARFAHNFSTMYGAGMAINNIFERLTDNVLGNRHLDKLLSLAYQNIQKGQTIAEGFENAGGFPPLLLGAIKNGEVTGTLDESFTRLGDYFDTEVKRTVQTMVNAFEPLTIILLGGVFGLIILSIMLPLYDVVGDLGKAY